MKAISFHRSSGASRCVAHRYAARGPHRAYRAIFAAGLGALALIASGCGGGSPSGLGDTARGGRPGAEAIAYARCMRSHGVPNFPSPQISVSGNGGSVKMAVPASIVKDNPQFSKAQQACRKLQPNGGAPQRAPGARELAQAVKYAACVRSHGEPSFPDPNSRGVFVLGSQVNTEAPQFAAAERACQAAQPHALAVQQVGPGGP